MLTVTKYAVRLDDGRFLSTNGASQGIRFGSLEQAHLYQTQGPAHRAATGMLVHYAHQLNKFSPDPKLSVVPVTLTAKGDE